MGENLLEFPFEYPRYGEKGDREITSGAVGGDRSTPISRRGPYSAAQSVSSDDRSRHCSDAVLEGARRILVLGLKRNTRTSGPAKRRPGGGKKRRVTLSEKPCSGRRETQQISETPHRSEYSPDCSRLVELGSDRRREASATKIDVATVVGVEAIIAVKENPGGPVTLDRLQSESGISDLNHVVAIIDH
jgi:hypothetical protein